MRWRSNKITDKIKGTREIEKGGGGGGGALFNTASRPLKFRFGHKNFISGRVRADISGNLEARACNTRPELISRLPGKTANLHITKLKKFLASLIHPRRDEF